MKLLVCIVKVNFLYIIRFALDKVYVTRLLGRRRRALRAQLAVGTNTSNSSSDK